MISLEEYKKALGGKILNELTEEQIMKLRDQDDQLAEILFNSWLEVINKSKNKKQ